MKIRESVFPKIPKIYDEFEREDNDINRVTPSSGLGLNIAKILLSLMNGKIDIDSTPGKGTRVKTTQVHRYADKKDVAEGCMLIDNMHL